MSECDNISRVHDPVTIGEDENALRIFCRECKNQYVIRKDPFKTTPEIRQYVKIFRKDALQGKDNLFYKYYDQFLIK